MAMRARVPWMQRPERRHAALDIHRAIAAYHSEGLGEHHRYRSWEHCYAYFRAARRRGIARERDHAARAASVGGMKPGSRKR